MNDDDIDLGGPEPDWDTDPAPPIDTDEANRWLWRIGRLDDEADEVRAIAAAERERVDAWERERLHVIGGQRDWLANSCRMFMAAVRRLSNDRTKSIPLPNGTLTSSGSQPDWRYEDEKAFLSWARDNAPDLVRTPEPPPDAPDKAAAKKALQLPPGAKPGDVVEVYYPDPETGELVPVPGVKVEIREPTYDVKPLRRDRDDADT